MTEETYIGDGVYAKYDGFGVTLWTDREDTFNIVRHWIYLEPSLIAALLAFYKSATGQREDSPRE